MALQIIVALRRTILATTSKVRRVVKILIDILRNSRLSPEKASVPQIYLQIAEAINIKTLREILIMLELSGYHVLLRGQFSIRTIRIGDLFEWHKNVKLIWRDPPMSTNIPVWTDRQDIAKDRQGGKVVYLRFEYWPNIALKPDQYVMPIPMHPQIYVQYREHEKLQAYRISTRKIRILFAGNWNEAGYNNPLLGEMFGKLTRFQILDFLQAKNLVKNIHTQQELDDLLSGSYWNGFVLLSKAIRINQADWLRMISQSDFFLCPPGVLFPWSHNSAEAMAVGTIPLINYPDWFFPPIETQKQCIAFSSTAELEHAIDNILHMSAEEVAAMRSQVIDYYVQHLDPCEFVSRLMDNSYPSAYLYFLWDESEEALRTSVHNPRFNAVIARSE